MPYGLDLLPIEASPGPAGIRVLCGLFRAPGGLSLFLGPMDLAGLLRRADGKGVPASRPHDDDTLDGVLAGARSVVAVGSLPGFRAESPGLAVPCSRVDRVIEGDRQDLGALDLGLLQDFSRLRKEEGIGLGVVSSSVVCFFSAIPRSPPGCSCAEADRTENRASDSRHPGHPDVGARDPCEIDLAQPELP